VVVGRRGRPARDRDDGRGGVRPRARRRPVRLAGGASGGVRGTLLAAILRARPGLRGVLFDQPHVVADAALPERCEAVAGSFFAAVPAGAEIYTLRWSHRRRRATPPAAANVLPAVVIGSYGTVATEARAPWNRLAAARTAIAALGEPS
jgi:hypothetical protein